ncbi:putative Longin-like domain superfamily, coatomer subunit zeta protein [Helianthus annuus]|nr:putative Longin-like domain superfamily, coatomer subunit zeta protein [Helianthus annuus]
MILIVLFKNTYRSFKSCQHLILICVSSKTKIQYLLNGLSILFFFLLMSEAIFVVTSAIKDVCGKPPTERLFLDKYGRICLCLDEIVWKGLLENTDKDRIKRLIRLKPPTEF